MELKGTHGNSRELKRTQGNSREGLKEALVEVTEGKKLRKRGKEGKFRKSEKKKKKKKRENIEALYERLKIQNFYTVFLGVVGALVDFALQHCQNKWCPFYEMGLKYLFIVLQSSDPKTTFLCWNKKSILYF